MNIIEEMESVSSPYLIGAGDSFAFFIFDRPFADGFEARIIGLDLAVSAKDQYGIIRELEHAIWLSYELDIKHGQAPLMQKKYTDPQDAQILFGKTKLKQIGELHLSEGVSASLRIALAFVVHPKTQP